jgi:PAS domain S-box-containing protein
MPRVPHFSTNGHDDDSVLIVNDIPEQLSLMDSLLRKAGYWVLTAGDGLEAFEVAKRERPDVVISDVSMPRVNGIEFCRLIREDDDLRFLPILLVSAHRRDTESVVEGLRSGADDYLEMPFDSTRLIAKVSRLLERSKLETSYRDLVEKASDIIFTQDMEGRLTSINSAGKRFFGAVHGHSGEAPSAHKFDINLPRIAQLQDPDRIEAGGEVYYQFRARNAEGQERWLEIATSTIKDRLGDAMGFRAVARDITDRKEIELALRESQERYRLLFDSTPQPILVYDEESHAILAVNEAAINSYGYSRDEFLTLTFDDLRSNGNLSPETISSGSLDEPLVSKPLRQRRKDKSTIYVELISLKLIFNNRNARLVIANDVTERKLLDEKQRSMHASLQQSALEWRRTFDAIDFPVLIIDLEGQIKRLNQAAEAVAGSDNREIVGRNISELGGCGLWKKASELIKAIHDNGGSVSTELRDTSSGKTWSISLYLIHEFGAFGQRAIFIAQDITKRAELEASLRQGEMMVLLGSLVAGVAHEVRNPLFGISSILDAFETRFSDRTDYLRYTNVLRDEVGRLTVLMEELLEYGKPFRGELQAGSVAEVVARSLRACSPAAATAKVELVNKIYKNLPSVMIDRRRLSKVFVNLIENAIQHSNAGGVVSVEAQEVLEGNQLWVDYAVRDAGPGIQDQDLPKIFEPFFSKRRGGTGLGLAIAARIMGEHGGKLIAENNPKRGACMIARFPVADLEETING